MATLQLTDSQISPLDALWALFKSQPKRVRDAFIRRIKEDDSETRRQKELVKDSLTRAMQELRLAQEGKIQLKDARQLFK